MRSGSQSARCRATRPPSELPITAGRSSLKASRNAPTKRAERPASNRGPGAAVEAGQVYGIDEVIMRQGWKHPRPLACAGAHTVH